MATLFEQYEKTSGLQDRRTNTFQEVTSSGYIDATLEEELPIFRRHKMNIRCPTTITHLVANKGHIVIGMINKTLLWFGPKDYDRPNEIKLQAFLGDRIAQSKLYNLFLDLNGNFLIISLASTDGYSSVDNYLLFFGTYRPTLLKQTKGHLLSSVAWNFDHLSEATTTDFILVGTSQGFVYETELWHRSTPEQYWKQVFDIGVRTEITGLAFHKIASARDQYFVLVTTKNRIYQFVGGISTDTPVLLHLFTIQDPDIEASFEELPGSPDVSCIDFYYPESSTTPKTYAWLTQPGISYGDINQNAEKKIKVTTNTTLISYPYDSSPFPLGIVLTKFHVLIAYIDRVKAVCVLNGQLVHDDVFSEVNIPLVGITKDVATGTIWAFAEKSIFRYGVNNEERDIWEAYLDKKNYELAKEHCQNQPLKLDKVLTKEAQDLFSKAKYKESAKLYAQTASAFEEVALKLIQLEEEEALQIFLIHKLGNLKNNDKAQITMVVFWLLELYLNWLGTLRHTNKTLYQKVMNDFQTLMTQAKVKESITANMRAVYNLISNHGDDDNLIYFITLMQDYERVVKYHLQHNNYEAALEILNKQSKPELFYQFSPILMQMIPKETVDVWLHHAIKLDPIKLIPALIQAENHNQNEEVMRFLEYCVYTLNNQDQALHNFLLALYAHSRSDKLMSYLDLQGQDEASIPYDLKYALRLCSDLGLKEACVHIYSIMGLFEEAVDVALGVNLDLAKANADKPENNEELVKKLWLKIAKHVVKEENNIEKAMEFLQDCELIKIEDILPFFSDFVTIDHFKEAICSSLHEYNHHIEALKKDMDQATDSAMDIKGEIQQFRSRSLTVQGDEKCSLCEFPVLTRSFYLFPCQHSFHADCIIAEVLPILTESKRKRAEELQTILSYNTSSVTKDESSSVSSLSIANAKEKLSVSFLEGQKAELDELIASECLFCGEIMIRCVDLPFIDPKDYQDVMKTWE